MSTPSKSPPPARRVNVRTPEVMALVEEEVERHYRSDLVERIRERGGVCQIGPVTIRLAKEFGFCYGVERAIDLAYAARRVFKEKKIFLIGEIIHNPSVNEQLAEKGIRTLSHDGGEVDLSEVGEEDVVIVPAFGAPTKVMEELQGIGCAVVDTTCGDVMRVWKRVRQNARRGFTSIIHGKADHEETLATASRAQGDDGRGHFLVLLSAEDVETVCHYIVEGGDKERFLERFAGAYSPGFHPDLHLERIGVANQTTMLKSETLELQRRLAEAVRQRVGEEHFAEYFQSFDTICGATQERQDSLYELLRQPLDALFVVGGYNSSNTTHLVEIAQQTLPTYFIRNAQCLHSLGEIIHFDIEQQREVTSGVNPWSEGRSIAVGITAGASCPNNLIEETIDQLFALKGISSEEVRRQV